MPTSRFLPFFFALLFLAAAASAQVTVTGTVVDPSGAAVANAAVALHAGSATVASATSDEQGVFRFDGVMPGRYQLVVDGGSSFSHLRRSVSVGATPPQPFRLQLALAALQESVDVTADEVRPTVDTAANLDTTRLTGTDLEELPVFDQDFVGSLTQFLDPASIATGGTTLVVDGVEVTKPGVPRSAVQEIAINDDPYSAEYSRPGRGRIEIVTKPGGEQLHGTFNYTFRNSALATRSYFATRKPSEQRQALEGLLGGPLGKRTSFLLTFSQKNDDAAAFVHALTPAGAFDQAVATPSTRSEVMGRMTHDWNEKHRSTLQFNWERAANTLQGAGGFVLPQAAVNSVSREFQTLFTLNSVLTPSRLNQFQLTVEVNREPTRSVSPAAALIVRDAFVGGGAQANLLRTESGGKVNDIMTLSRKNQVLKFGLQIPNLNRRVFDDQTNRGGTFSFATLADYADGRPYAYTVQQGSGRTSFWWREYGAFVQDQITVSPNLQIALGLRYDWQAFFHDTNNVSPRVSLAWSPRKDRKTVVRAGGGLFYDRSGVAPVASLFLHNGVLLRSYTITNPSYPDPFAGGATLSNVASNVTELAPDVQIPYTLQYSASVERQLAKGVAATVGYRASRGHHLFRSVDVNAPLPPDFSNVPDARLGHVQQIRSDGSLRSDSLELTLKGKVAKRLSGQLQYTWSRALNDTGGIFWYPADQYAPAASEWGPADFDVRHRLNVLATLNTGRWGKVGLSGRFASALPYNLTAGDDLFHTALSNARPAGVGRNSLRASSYANVDVRWSRELPLTLVKGGKGNGLTLSLDAFNVFNHPNFTGYVGNVRSPFYLSPTTVSPGRRIQLSAEVSFGG
jgi:outer membrane receptor protein involved in Fe transport